MDLHVEEYGSGSPALVLMHGFGGSARNLRPQARFFRARHRVVLFDARGHARSAAPEDAGEYELHEFVGDVERVLARTGEGRVVLGGISMGAAVALEFALTHPGSLVGLVLASYPAPGGSSFWASDFADAIERRGLEPAGEEFIWGGSRFDAEARRFIRQGFLEHSAHALVAILRRLIARLPSPSSDPRLRALAFPTLVVAGAEDVASLAPSRELAAVIPQAELVVIPEAGHVANLQKPELFNGALNDFLCRIEG